MRSFFIRTQLYTLSLVLSSLVSLQAQQDPQFTMYMFNKLPYNPAYAGVEGVWTTKVLLRNQWLGFEGHPVTQSFATDVYLNMFRQKFGIGVHVINDKLGADATTNLKLDFNWQPRVSFGTLSIGFNAGFVQRSTDGLLLRAATGSYADGVDHGGDPSIPDGQQAGGTADFGAGAYFKGKNFWVGAAAMHITEPSVDFETALGTLSQPLTRNIYIMGGYDYDINLDYTLKSSLLVKTDAVKAQYDIDILLDYQKSIWGGLGRRGITADQGDAIMAILGLKLTEQLILGYSYDITTSEIKNYSSGSHEFLLGYRLVPPKKIKKDRIIRCPRFL